MPPILNDMKTKIILGWITLLTAFQSHAALSFTGGTIDDGNPAGSTFQGSVSGAGGTITGVTVGLNLSGGYNGDLYAYLVSPDGTLVMLLNRPGTDAFGAPGSGLNVTLADAAATSIQTAAETAGVQFTGAYQAAGSLAGFNGGVADGTWTLFFADMSSGGGTSTLTGWSLDITAVPEPVNEALALGGVILVAAGLWRRCQRRQVERL